MSKKLKIFQSRGHGDNDAFELLMTCIGKVAVLSEELGKDFDYYDFCCDELGMGNTEALEFLDIYGGDENEDDSE